jgi:isochorismate synthase/2-succinyl-5-enolpyruvyl-6-hydroxy-3-cyclohexene-1-carboxylate synthase/2-succinyl-6-hydroxy-2,4-cyclohexadiene-1-carboxylate synthase/O-succinylbenzoate synthase
MLQQRQAGDAAQLSDALSGASPGRAPSLWHELPAAAAAGVLPPLLLVAGREDVKFAGLARKLAAQLAPASDGSTGAGGAAARVALVPGCGHAVHVEAPLQLLALLRDFSSGAARAER